MLALADDDLMDGQLTPERIAHLLKGADDPEVWILEPSLEIFTDYE